MTDMFNLIAVTYIPPLGVAAGLGILIKWSFEAFCGRW